MVEIVHSSLKGAGVRGSVRVQILLLLFGGKKLGAGV